MRRYSRWRQFYVKNNPQKLAVTYLFPDHDVILVVAVVCVPQLTFKKRFPLK